MRSKHCLLLLVRGHIAHYRLHLAACLLQLSHLPGTPELRKSSCSRSLNDQYSRECTAYQRLQRSPINVCSLQAAPGRHSVLLGCPLQSKP